MGSTPALVMAGMVVALLAGYASRASEQATRAVTETETRLAAQRDARSTARYRSGFWWVVTAVFVVVVALAYAD